MLIDEEAWDHYVRPYMDQWNDVENPERRQDHDEEDDQTVMMARRPRSHRSMSSSSATSTMTSYPMSSREPSSGDDTWRRTVVFTLDGTAASCLLPDDPEAEQIRRIATALSTTFDDIVEIVHVPDRPADLIAMDLQCMLVQRHADRRPITFLRLILLDLEIIEPNEILPGAFRRLAKWLPHVMTTTTLFRILSVEDLYRQHEDKTHFWINNERIDLLSQEPHTIVDGDYLKIYIGSDDQRFHCDVDQEDTMMIQLHGKHQAKVGEQHLQPATSYEVCHGRARRRQALQRRDRHREEEDPDERRLRAIWNRPHLQTRGLENEPVMMFETWFLSALDSQMLEWKIGLPS